jgi:hypothetical protein
MIVAASCLAATASAAQDADQASTTQQAAAYVDRLETADLGQVYDQDMADTFHALMARKAFIGLISVARIQAGGVHAARELVGASVFDHLPTGQTGNFYFVRFKTRFPNGVVFQDVYLQKIGASWKVAGSLSGPAPLTDRFATRRAAKAG